MDYYVISWNIEGLQRNIYNLQYFVFLTNPSFIFLSEPQIFVYDVDLVMQAFSGKFNFSLNSEDMFDMDLSMDKVKAKGGTLVMWDSKLDQHVTVLHAPSPAVIPLLDQSMSALSDLNYP